MVELRRPLLLLRLKLCRSYPEGPQLNLSYPSMLRPLVRYESWARAGQEWILTAALKYTYLEHHSSL